MSTRGSNFTASGAALDKRTLLGRLCDEEAKPMSAAELRDEVTIFFAGHETLANTLTWAQFTNLPFGAGPHMCIGLHLAMAEMLIVLAMFARRASLVVEKPESVRMQSTITLQVAGGLPVRVEMRRTT